MHNPLAIEGRTVLVTGASGGLGRAICQKLARLGARVVLTGRSEEKLELALQSLEGTGHFAKACELSELEGLAAWMKSIVEKAGPLSGFVHSAGIHQLHPLQIATPEKVDQLMRINVLSAMEITRSFRRRNHFSTPASIVYLSSIMGLVGQAGVSAYSASKGALVALARSHAIELADQSIRVNCVCPGVVRTELATQAEEPLQDHQVQALEDLHPLGWGEPEDVANAVAFLLCDASRWITGQALAVDGGYTAQ